MSFDKGIGTSWPFHVKKKIVQNLFFFSSDLLLLFINHSKNKVCHLLYFMLCNALYFAKLLFQSIMYVPRRSLSRRWSMTCFTHFFLFFAGVLLSHCVQFLITFTSNFQVLCCLHSYYIMIVALLKSLTNIVGCMHVCMCVCTHAFVTAGM